MITRSDTMLLSKSSILILVNSFGLILQSFLVCRLFALLPSALAQFEGGGAEVAEVRQILNDIKIASIKKFGAFSDYVSHYHHHNLLDKAGGMGTEDPTLFHARQSLKTANFDEGTEATANREVAEDLFENDIVLTLPQAKTILDEVQASAPPPRGRRPKRQAAPALSSFWTKLNIPFIFQYSDADWQQLIRRAQAHIQSETCISFYQASNKSLPRDYLQYIRGSGCWSSVGRVGGRQQVSIGYGCDAMGIVAHETLHALGLWHEQSRTDRDAFIAVNYDDIYPGTQSNFEKRTPATSDNMGQPYDLGSVMHYGSRAFSIDYNKYSVVTRDKAYQQTIGQRQGISFKDAKMINFRYCDKICSRALNCRNGGYTNPNDCSRCKCPEGYGGTLCDQIPASNVAQCRGGEYSASTRAYAIRSPYVTARTKCYYRIKAPANMKIEITVTQVSFPCKNVCDSYVEVKYKNDKISTGARLCCKLPQGAILSEGEEVLVIFRGADDDALRGGYLGFQFLFKAVGNSVTTTTTAPDHRIVTDAPSTTSVPPTTGGTGEWSNWAAWGVCTVSCGGCGVRRRVRACYGGNGKCNGFAWENESCGQAPCPILSKTTRCKGRLLMPCDLIQQLDFGTVLKENTIFNDNSTIKPTTKLSTSTTTTTTTTTVLLSQKTTKSTAQNFVRRQRNAENLSQPSVLDFTDEPYDPATAAANGTQLLEQLLETERNAKILQNQLFSGTSASADDVETGRSRRFVDASKQSNPRVYCEKLFSYNCPTALLTISMDWKTAKDTQSFDGRLCCAGYHSSGNSCVKQP